MNAILDEPLRAEVESSFDPRLCNDGKALREAIVQMTLPCSAEGSFENFKTRSRCEPLLRFLFGREKGAAGEFGGVGERKEFGVDCAKDVPRRNWSLSP